MSPDFDPSDIGVLIPPARLAPYIAVAGERPRDIEAFYLWCEELALALFADIGRLEVLMRSAMARELVRAFGLEWYERSELFDDDATGALRSAWRRNDLHKWRRPAGEHGDGTDHLQLLEGKLVAGLMFGFWVRLLGRGTYVGRPRTASGASTTRRYGAQRSRRHSRAKRGGMSSVPLGSSGRHGTASRTTNTSHGASRLRGNGSASR